MQNRALVFETHCKCAVIHTLKKGTVPFEYDVGETVLVLDKAMKYAIAIVGAMTGFSVTRFVLMSAGMNLMSFTSIGIMAVSYTHLDVYKRQI